MSERIADAVEDVADILEKGWVQHRDWQPGVGYCIVGGANVVALSTKLSVSQILEPVIRQLDPKLWWSVEGYNDAPGRTKQEVLDLLRLSAKEERKFDA